tara:strand:+ start:668 stop:1936 length:1269 start_codon:yes stop_codon:yes gene_type:complete
MEEFNIIIMGGGIAGLYIQYTLLKKFLKKKKRPKILLIEKNNRLGGRIFTHKEIVKGEKYSMEAGAGRFNDNHKLLIKLIKKLGYSKNIVKIPSIVDVRIKKEKWVNNDLSLYSPYDYMDSIISQFTIKKKMKNISFENWLKKNTNTKLSAYLKDFYPYKDIFKSNTYDALNSYKKDLNNNNNFYTLRGGLTQLIEKLKLDIISMGGIIKVNTTLLNIRQIGKNYLIKTSHFKAICGKIILTGQRPDLLKIKYLKNISNLLNSVRNIKLCRFYCIFDTKNGAWFENIKKTITDSRISYFIPIDYETGLVMISYVDDYNANYLKKLELKSEKKIINFLLKECEQIFGIEKIPQPIWYKSFYWKNGVGGWKTGVDSKKNEKKIIVPYENENLFICGENYSSKFQGWIEGSLITAKKVISKIYVD